MTFTDHAQPLWWLATGAACITIVALLLRRYNVSLVLVALAAVAMAFAFHGPLTFGPSSLHFPELSTQAFTTAAVVLVLPQLPLTFANSCLATADVARTYFGAAADRVRPGRLALSLGTANLVAGAICGMPICPWCRRDDGSSYFRCSHGWCARSFGACAPCARSCDG